MNKLTKQTVYVPVSVSDRNNIITAKIAEEQNPIILFDNGEVRRIKEDFLSALSTHWLKELPNMYLLSQEELDNILRNAFNAGKNRIKHEYSTRQRSAFDWLTDEKLYPNEEKYISTLLNPEQ